MIVADGRCATVSWVPITQHTEATTVCSGPDGALTIPEAGHRRVHRRLDHHVDDRLPGVDLPASRRRSRPGQRWAATCTLVSPAEKIRPDRAGVGPRRPWWWAGTPVSVEHARVTLTFMGSEHGTNPTDLLDRPRQRPDRARAGDRGRDPGQRPLQREHGGHADRAHPGALTAALPPPSTVGAMSGGREGTPWPDPGEKAPFTWGTRPAGRLHGGCPVRAARRTRGVPLRRTDAARGPVRDLGSSRSRLPHGLHPDGSLPHSSSSSPSQSRCRRHVEPQPSDDRPLVGLVLVPDWPHSPCSSCTRSGSSSGAARRLGCGQMEIRLFRIDDEGQPRSTQLCTQRLGSRPSRRRPAGSSSSPGSSTISGPLGDTRRQCIHDKIARTVAVDLRSEGVVAAR